LSRSVSLAQETIPLSKDARGIPLLCEDHAVASIYDGDGLGSLSLASLKQEQERSQPRHGEMLIRRIIRLVCRQLAPSISSQLMHHPDIGLDIAALIGTPIHGDGIQRALHVVLSGLRELHSGPPLPFRHAPANEHRFVTYFDDPGTEAFVYAQLGQVDPSGSSSRRRTMSASGNGSWPDDRSDQLREALGQADDAHGVDHSRKLQSLKQGGWQLAAHCRVGVAPVR
jgi:hypothetical protein